MQKLLFSGLVLLSLSSAVFASSDCAKGEYPVTVTVESPMPLNVVQSDGTNDMLFVKGEKDYCYKRGATVTVSYLDLSGLSAVDEFMDVFSGESWTTSMSYQVSEPLTISSSSPDGVLVSLACSTQSGRDCLKG